MTDQLGIIAFLKAQADTYHKRGDRDAYWEYRRLFLLAQAALREQERNVHTADGHSGESVL